MKGKGALKFLRVFLNGRMIRIRNLNENEKELLNHSQNTVMIWCLPPYKGAYTKKLVKKKTVLYGVLFFYQSPIEAKEIIKQPNYYRFSSVGGTDNDY